MMTITQIPWDAMPVIIEALDAQWRDLGEGMTVDEYERHVRMRRLRLFPVLLRAGVDPLQPLAYDAEFGWQAHGLHFEHVPRSKYQYQDLAEDVASALEEYFAIKDGGPVNGNV